MAKKPDAPDAQNLTEGDTIATPSAPAAQAHVALADDVLADDPTPIDPQEDLRAIAAKLKTLLRPRNLQQTLVIFTMVRNTKWGVSTRNGIPIDVTNPDHQWEKNKQIRTASWTEIAKLPNQYNLDIRGDNNQLWFTQSPDMDKDGTVIKRYPARPVKGYNDDELPQPQRPGKHWLADIRPDLFARHERLVQGGGGVPLPNMPATTGAMAQIIAIFEQDLIMAERNLASRGVR